MDTPRRRLGAHTSTGGGLHRALERGAALGCDVVQVFTSSARQWAPRPLPDEELLAWHDARRRTGVEPAMSHASYLINLAQPKEREWRQAIAGLAVEHQRCQALGIPYVVLHPGAHLGKGEEAGIARIAQAIDALHEEQPDDPTVLLLETTAGQGTSIGHRFEELRDLLGLVARRDRVGVCLDTQHLHAAGYPLGTAEGFAATVADLERTIGLANVRAVHVNDSKRPHGARVDRHEHIGRGHLGLEAFRLLLAEPRLAHLPMAIETPKQEGMDARAPDADPADQANLGLLRALEGRASVGEVRPRATRAGRRGRRGANVHSSKRGKEVKGTTASCAWSRRGPSS